MRPRWVAALAVAAACTPITGPDVDPSLTVIAAIDQPFDLRIGQRAFVEAAATYVRFREVSSDSRCPSDALILCAWEGDAAVELEIDPVGGPGWLGTLHTTLDPKALNLGPVVLRLEELAPYPRTTTPIPAKQYVATLVVRPSG